ncbi:MAG: hypothetical protein DMD81_27585, partial [Candidatus Rokuibacteriota bacterium]
MSARKRPAGDASPRRRPAKSRKSPTKRTPTARERELAKRVRVLEREAARARARLDAESQTHAREVAEGLDQWTAASDILRVIASSRSDAKPVFDAIVKSASRLCGGEYAIVTRFDGQLLHLIAQHNARPGAAEPTAQIFPRPPGRSTSMGRAILERTLVHVPDVPNDPDYDQDLVRAAGLGAVLTVPMLRDGEPIGAISVSRSTSGPFPERQIELLKTFADQAVIAIENVRLFQELETRNRDLWTSLDRQTATADVLRIIAQSPTELQPVLDAIAASAVRLCAASDAVIERLEGDRLYNAAHAGTQ